MASVLLPPLYLADKKRKQIHRRINNNPILEPRILTLPAAEIIIITYLHLKESNLYPVMNLIGSIGARS